MKSRLAVWVMALLVLGVSACTALASSGQPELKMAPESALPDFARNAPPQVKEAYRFAAANPEVLKAIPCYCGCGAIGHTSNLDCYVKAVRPDGSVEFDNHASGCSTCVDITRDVMRLMREGKDLKTIRSYVDTTYSQYGPATNTEPVK